MAARERSQRFQAGPSVEQPTATDVFVSSLLAMRHPSLHAELEVQIRRFGMRLREISGTQDIWCRDYMPIPVGDRFVQFRYAPDYLAEAPSLVTGPEVASGLVGRCARSDLVIDGGNIVRRGRTVVVTDKVFTENPSCSHDRVIGELRDLLEADRLVVIPTEPGDVVGHADGVLHLVDEHVALVNDYTVANRAYGRSIREALNINHIEQLLVPYAPDLRSRRKIPPATGVYTNLLETSYAVFVPVYQIPSDDRAVAAVAKAFERVPVHAVDCARLAMQGGSLHCVTWEANAFPR